MSRNHDNILTEWLVLNAQSGKIEALNQLLKIWYPKFLRYSTQQLQNEEAAKDVVQDTLILLAKKIVSLRDPVAFPKWAYQILHRRGVDHQRVEIRRRNNESANRVLNVACELDDRCTLNIDASQTVGHALQQLDGDCYTVVHLHYLHELSLREIAVICHIPVGTVKSRLHTARKKLKKLLVDTL